MTDLAADLATDLQRPVPLPSPGPLAPPAAPGLPESGSLPAVAVVLTPLRWSWPALAPAERGTGLAVRLGPWRVEVAL